MEVSSKLQKPISKIKELRPKCDPIQTKIIIPYCNKLQKKGDVKRKTNSSN